jgi:hypothetical protein
MLSKRKRIDFHLRLKGDYGVLESGAILILSAVDWMSTEKRVRND